MRPASPAGLIPGITLCALVVIAALLLERLETALFGRAWIDALVVAILIGAAVRTAWAPGPRWRPGIDVSAKLLLEIAVVLLGASLDAALVAAIGIGLLAGIAAIVAIILPVSFGIGLALGLSPRLAVLVACGNSICGNSAIAAVAPLVGAKSDEVAASIAFTAVLGVAVVLLLPLIGAGLGMTGIAYGALAGLTVYAVPQVVAATAPVAASAVQVGTLVKLVRVLMLGPVCLALAPLARRFRDPGDESAAPRRPGLARLVPWFVLGFLAMAALRTVGAIPAALVEPIDTASGLLMLVAMAALGLGVDVRSVARSGAQVTVTVLLSLVALGSISFGLVRLLQL